MTPLPPRSAPLVIRPATASDVSAIAGFDPHVAGEAGRRDCLARVIAAGACYVALDDDLHVSGYLVLEHSFFAQGFVALLYVAAEHRRQGVGAALMAYAESLCETSKLFTSTNLSNHPVQALLARLGYKLSGVIHDLDEGDPELIYVKYLRR